MTTRKPEVAKIIRNIPYSMQNFNLFNGKIRNNNRKINTSGLITNIVKPDVTENLVIYPSVEVKVP